jgi:glycosyltransferase involved in cell wall biosynthesis
LNPSIIAIIPCYNVAPFCEKVIQETLPFACHIIPVDDGSTDGTSQILNKIALAYPEKITLLSFSKNKGKGFALLEGFKYASTHFNFETLMTLDGDAQHDPAYIPLLADSIQKGAELVIGGRTFSQMPWKSRFANRWISFFLKCIHAKAPVDSQSGMRAFSYPLVKEIVRCIQGGKYEMEFHCLLLALSQKRNIEEIPISTLYLNNNRASHFSPIRDSIRILTAFFLFLIRKQ